MDRQPKNSKTNKATVITSFRLSRVARAVGIAGLVLAAGVSGGVYAAQGGKPGKPADGNSPPDFGDLVILSREVSGVPHRTPGSANTGWCKQPIAFDSDYCQEECKVAGVDEDGVETGDTVVAVDPATCAVLAECAPCTQEVDFGRINEARSPDSVFASQLEDATVNLATADCVSLDPAGRLVTSRVLDETTTLTSAIDSPLQNMAIYRELMLQGGLGVDGLPIDTLPTAARALGAASDKSGEVTVDLVSYINRIMGLTAEGVNTVLDPPLCQTYREEVSGVVKVVQECFLNYGGFPYNRDDNFTGLPSPAYIPEGTPVEGNFEYLAGSDPNFYIAQGPIVTAVFDDTAYSGADIGGFARAADDTRAVIDFMHSWPIPDPDTYATPVPCEVSGPGNPTYDLAISDISGLQVPMQIVDGSTEREFTVTVTNAGPDDAVATVTVHARIDGVDVSNSPWEYEDVPIAANALPFVRTEFVPIDTGGVRATIEWEATVDGQYDVNPTNDTATATSSVKVTGGGGGGGRP